MASRSNKTMRYAPNATAQVSAPKTPPRSDIMNSVRSTVANRGANATSATLARPFQDATDRNGNRLGPRRTLGPADPVTRRAAIDAALQPGPPVKQQPVKTAQPVDDGPLAGSGGRARSRKINDLVSKMQ